MCNHVVYHWSPSVEIQEILKGDSGDEDWCPTWGLWDRRLKTKRLSSKSTFIWDREMRASEEQSDSKYEELRCLWRTEVEYTNTLWKSATLNGLTSLLKPYQTEAGVP